MRAKIFSSILMVLSLGIMGGMTITAQIRKALSPSAIQGKKEASEHTATKTDEPHHTLAMAYHQNLAIFARALHEQTSGADSVNVEFARAAVAEMRRSFGQMKEHHQAHMQGMSAEMRARMSGMMPQMETHQRELDALLTSLEQAVSSAAPDAKNVSSLAAGVLTHLDAMARMRQGVPMGKMKMPMK